jgi:hypothetical protein
MKRHTHKKKKKIIAAGDRYLVSAGKAVLEGVEVPNSDSVVHRARSHHR